MNDPDSLDYFTIGTLLEHAFEQHEDSGVIAAIIDSYATARDINPQKLAIVAVMTHERVRRIEQAVTASRMMSEGIKIRLDMLLSGGER